MSESSEPLTIVVNGEPITASMDEWSKVSSAILDRHVADRRAWESAQRESGQVWTARYLRYHVERSKECFSLEAAKRVLISGEEAGEMSAQGIECPDGTFLDFSYKWYEEAAQ